MQLAGSLPHLQDPTACLFTKSRQSSPCFPILFFEDLFLNYLPI